ncbi:1790_t:CDS:2 [Ambispora gerdemannii]|uniref:1790_t:CDS:1 n=1 Tax=Ambispora gerdemannii TaxID=144530 RepID=A0A9N8V151_9GLOM|nr:1790_t:CDS:2 [Ambispora gerdemannii]
MANKTQQRGGVGVGVGDGKNNNITSHTAFIVTLPTKTPNESAAGLTTHPEIHQKFTTFNNTNIVTDNNNNTDQSRNFSHVLSEIISTLDPATHNKILQQTKLSIEELIKPKGKFRNGVPPRPQNPWVIYRKDLQAKLVAEQGAEIEFGARVGSISRMASEKWNVEPQEVKQVYEIIAEVAKRVHEQMFPNYKYKPRRKGNNSGFSRRSSSASDNSLEGSKKNLGDFTTNTSTFQIERPTRRKSSASDTNNPLWTISSPIPSPSITATSSTDSIQQPPPPTPHSAGGAQSIIPSWTLFDTGRSSPNIFTDGNSPNHNNNQVLNHQNQSSLPLMSASHHQSNNINSFNSINGHNNIIITESTTGSFIPSDFDIQGPFQHITNQLLEMSPSITYTVAYDQSLTRLFGTP